MPVTVPDHRRPQTFSIWIEDAHGHAMHEWRGLTKVVIAGTYDFVRRTYPDMTIVVTWDSYRECRNCEGKGQVSTRYGCSQCGSRGEVLTGDRTMKVSHVSAFLNEAHGEARRAEEERKRRWGF